MKQCQWTHEIQELILSKLLTSDGINIQYLVWMTTVIQASIFMVACLASVMFLAHWMTRDDQMTG